METIADVARVVGLVAAGVVLYTVVVLAALLALGERYHRVKQARAGSAGRAAGPAPGARSAA